MSDHAIFVSRAEAKSLGLKRYFTGEPCTNGHVEERLISNGNCKECSRDKDRRRHQKNPLRTKHRLAKWRLGNRDRYQAHARKWQVNNPEACAAIASRRRVRKLNAAGSHTVGEVRELNLKQGGCCAGCGVSFDFVPYTKDHIVCLAKGGTDFIENIQLVCMPCNDSKGTKDITNWCPPWDINQYVIGDSNG